MKANINIKGEKYTNIGVNEWGDNSIYIPTKEVAKMVRQFLKRNYKGLKTWVRTDSYSCGSSIAVYLSGTEYVTYGDQIYSELRSRFRSRSFNGMIDSWEDSDVYTDLGTKVTFGPDGISVYEKYQS